MRPSRLLLPVIVLLFSSISDVNAEELSELSREQRIERKYIPELKRIAVPSLIMQLKKADAEGCVIPLDSLSLIEPHRLLDAKIMNRPAGHVHPALLDERYYDLGEGGYRERNKLAYLEELRNGRHYLIRDARKNRPEVVLSYVFGGTSWLFHFDYDDQGVLKVIRRYAIIGPEEGLRPTILVLAEEIYYSQFNEPNISYHRLSNTGFKGGEDGFSFVTDFHSYDGGKTANLTVFPVLESGQQTESPCLFYRVVDGEMVSARLSGDTHCTQFHSGYFGVMDGVESYLYVPIAERDILFNDFEGFFAYRYPDVSLEELTVEFTAFQDGEATEARFLKGNRLLLEIKIFGRKGMGPERSFSWRMTFPDAILLAENEKYSTYYDWPDYSEATLIYKRHKAERRLTANALDAVRKGASLRKPYLIKLHPVLQLYLAERLKEAETPPTQRRLYSVSSAQASDLQRIIDSSRPGDTIRLHAGTYRLDKTLKLMDKSYLTLLADLGVEVLISDPHAPVIEMIRGNQVRLEGFRAKHEAADGCSTPVISIKDSRHIVLRHLELDGSGTHAVRMSFSRDILVEHNYLHSNSHAAFEMQSALKNVVIRFNRIENNPQVFQDSFLSGTGEIEFYGNTGQPLTRQRCKKLEERTGDRYVRCGRYQ